MDVATGSQQIPIRRWDIDHLYDTPDNESIVSRRIVYLYTVVSLSVMEKVRAGRTVIELAVLSALSSASAPS